MELMIDLTPHKSIMEKISKTGYKLEDAIAELIDNAIDARKQEKLKITIKIREGKIIVQDNGKGMDQETAANSIKLGFSTKKGKLGEFGLGLKTSALSLGNKFTILTGVLESRFNYKIHYNLNDWLEKGDWKQHPMNVINKKELFGGGTKIIIEDLKVEISEKELTKLVKNISTRFGPFLKSREIEIYVNNIKCVPGEIKLTEEGRKEFNLDLGDIKVTGWYGFKLAEHMKSYYGFNTYRRNRLITIYDKLGISDIQKAKQIVGEVNIEGIPVTHDKKDWIRESSEFKKVERTLKELISSSDKKMRKIVSGMSANPGRIQGTVKIVNSFIGRDIEDLMKVKPGDILVTQMTRPDFLLSARRAGAIITDLGGVSSHAAILSREFNIPTIVGTENATKLLKDGQKVIVDATEGVVYENK